MATHEHISDTELIALTRGHMYDTATMMGDVARRRPQHAYKLMVLSDQLKALADYLAPRTPASPSSEKPAE